MREVCTYELIVVLVVWLVHWLINWLPECILDFLGTWPADWFVGGFVWSCLGFFSFIWLVKNKVKSIALAVCFIKLVRNVPSDQLTNEQANIQKTTSKSSNTLIGL